MASPKLIESYRRNHIATSRKLVGQLRQVEYADSKAAQSLYNNLERHLRKIFPDNPEPRALVNSTCDISPIGVCVVDDGGAEPPTSCSCCGHNVGGDD